MNKRSEIQSPPTAKIDWCLSLMIANRRHKLKLKNNNKVNETLSKKNLTFPLFGFLNSLNFKTNKSVNIPGLRNTIKDLFFPLVPN